MIYFLANNGYHYYDVECHLVSGLEASLIIIPHKIEKYNCELFSKVYYYKTPWTSREWLKFFPVRRIIKKIKREISPRKNDVLFCYTEYEPLNQVVISHFKDHGARVYLIEDGGVASYLPNLCVNSDRFDIKVLFTEYLTRLALGEKYYEILKIGTELFPRMPDDYFDAILYYRPVSIRRKIKRLIISRAVEGLDGQDSSVLFLNQPLYQSFESEDGYFIALEKALNSLRKFPKILFKFHPRETYEYRLKISSYARSVRSDIRFLEQDDPVEFIIKQYKPGFSASFFTAGLLGLLEMGVEPIYLYRIAELRSNTLLDLLDVVLNELNYNFVSSFDNSYKSNLSSSYSVITINQLINDL